MKERSEKTSSYGKIYYQIFFKWAFFDLFSTDLFRLSSFFQMTQLYIDKSVDGMLGTRTWGGRIEGADESTELWRHPLGMLLCCSIVFARVWQTAIAHLTGKEGKWPPGH